jgi:predicted nucleic acid-binding protein
MRDAFLDTSYVVAIALDEDDATALARRLNAFGRVSASILLEAELGATLRREARPMDERLLEKIDWVHPDRSLAKEIGQVLDAGFVRGADCFHLACALYFAVDRAEVTFLTLDSRQRAVAKALGFKA